MQHNQTRKYSLAREIDHSRTGWHGEGGRWADVAIVPLASISVCSSWARAPVPSITRACIKAIIGAF